MGDTKNLLVTTIIAWQTVYGAMGQVPASETRSHLLVSGIPTI
ncbi:hypothetical protein [Coleofasciculus sp. G2-EDA-02]